LSELINKIKTQINNILDFKVGELSLRDSLSQIDSRASAVPIAAVITVFLFLVMQALVTSNEFDLGDEGASINISFLRQLQDTETQTAKKKPNRPEQEQEPDPPEMDIPETPRPEMNSESVSTLISGVLNLVPFQLLLMRMFYLLLKFRHNILEGLHKEVLKVGF